MAIFPSWQIMEIDFELSDLAHVQAVNQYFSEHATGGLSEPVANYDVLWMSARVDSASRRLTFNMSVYPLHLDADPMQGAVMFGRSLADQGWGRLVSVRSLAAESVIEPMINA